jgi:transposase
MSPHIGFGGGPSEDAAIGVYEGQILALGRGEAGCGGWGAFAKDLIHLRFICVLMRKEAQMNVRYRVELSQSEREELSTLLRGGRHAARKLKRAQILLAVDEGVGDEKIAATLRVSGSTIYRTKRRFVEANLEGALSEEPRPGIERKLSGKEEALLVATACSTPPPGRARWTLELLADALVKLTDHEELSRETVRRRLAENHLKPWRKDMWCIPKVDGEYVARMEDVLDLYAEAPDPNRPVVCFDESPTQLIGEVREPIPAKPGQLERYDCEYRRNGTVNLFVFLDAHRPWRKVKVTDRRTNQDFAHCMRDLVDVDYPDAPIIRVVMDNLSTHSPGSLYDAFPAPEAHRLLKRLEFHHTPKHASWLNMVEIEIGVLRSQCLDRRIDDKDKLVAEIAAWERQRNADKAQINWMFNTQKAREKLRSAYPVKES